MEILHEPVQWLKIIGVDEEEVPNLNHLKSKIIAYKNVEDVLNTYGVSCDTKKDVARHIVATHTISS